MQVCAGQLQPLQVRAQEVAPAQRAITQTPQFAQRVDCRVRFVVIPAVEFSDQVTDQLVVFHSLHLFQLRGGCKGIHHNPKPSLNGGYTRALDVPCFKM